MRALIWIVALAPLACGDEFEVGDAEGALYFNHGVTFAAPPELARAEELVVFRAAWERLEASRELLAFGEEITREVMSQNLRQEDERSAWWGERQVSVVNNELSAPKTTPILQISLGGTFGFGVPTGCPSLPSPGSDDHEWRVDLNRLPRAPLVSQSSVQRPDGSWFGSMLVAGLRAPDPQIPTHHVELGPRGVARICYSVNGDDIDLAVEHHLVIRAGDRREIIVDRVAARNDAGLRIVGTVHARWGKEGGIATFDAATVGDSTPVKIEECWDETFALTDRCGEP